MTDPIDPITLQSIPMRRRVRIPNSSIEGSSIWNAQSLASMLRRGNTRHPMTRLPLNAVTRELIHRHADDIELTFKTLSTTILPTFTVPRTMKLKEIVDLFNQRVKNPMLIYPNATWVINGRVVEDFNRQIKRYVSPGARTGMIHITITAMGGPSFRFAKRAWTRGNTKRRREHGAGRLHPDWLTKPGGPYH